MTLGRLSITAQAACVLSLGSSCLAATRAIPSVNYSQRRFNSVTAHVVTVNLNDPRIRVSVATPQRGFGYSESMRTFIRRSQPAAAITGTFFSTESLLPVGDIVVQGQKLHGGPAGAGFCVSADNTVQIQARQYGRTVNWSKYDTVLCTGPTLLRSGQKALDPRGEGYRDPSLFALRPRTAVGRTRSNKLLMVAVTKPIYLRHMMAIMWKLGARDAVGLDGGSSTALYWNGKMLVRPGRSLTNVLVVHRSTVASPTVLARLDNDRRWRIAAAQAKYRKPAPTLSDAVSSAIAVVGGAR